jgi:hypothetical protein
LVGGKVSHSGAWVAAAAAAEVTPGVNENVVSAKAGIGTPTESSAFSRCFLAGMAVLESSPSPRPRFSWAWSATIAAPAVSPVSSGFGRTREEDRLWAQPGQPLPLAPVRVFTLASHMQATPGGLCLRRGSTQIQTIRCLLPGSIVSGVMAFRRHAGGTAPWLLFTSPSLRVGCHCAATIGSLLDRGMLTSPVPAQLGQPRLPLVLVLAADVVVERKRQRRKGGRRQRAAV